MATIDDTWIDCRYVDSAGNRDAGIIVVTVTPVGTFINVNVAADAITVTAAPLGDYNEGVLATDTVITVTIGFGDPLAYTEPYKQNFAKWSRIGEMDYTVGFDEESNEMPLGWKGWVYDIIRLGNRAIYYGENGISALTPSGRYWGMRENPLYRIGLAGKQAVCGDDNIHYFIDNKGQMFSLGEGLTLLDYSEYLANMTNPVMSYDKENGFIYICDGEYGFIYNTRTGSLGEGPNNITGIGSQGGTLYVAAPAAISTDPIGTWTDTIDLGNRHGKSIHSMEISTDLSETLYVALRHRRDKSASWTQTRWYTVDQRGMVFIPVYGVEFQLGLRLSTYEYVEFDQINVNHTVHAH